MAKRGSLPYMVKAVMSGRGDELCPSLGTTFLCRRQIRPSAMEQCAGLREGVS